MPGNQTRSGADLPFSTTNYARVRDVLRADLINGVFEPGDRLKISVLAKRYEVSANPIREALQQLQGEGLVEILPNKGARVRTLDADVLRDWIEVREAMEVFFARRFVELASNRDIAALERIQVELEAAAAVSDMVEIARRNSAFHSFIHAVSRNREAISIIDKNTDLVRALRLRVGFSAGRLPAIISQHRALIQAFAARDAGLAQEHTSQHVLDAGNDLREQYDSVVRGEFAKSVDRYLARNRVPKGWSPDLSDRR